VGMNRIGAMSREKQCFLEEVVASIFDAAHPANSDRKFAIIILYCTAEGRSRGSAATGRENACL
jgi:hypothetical protein